MVIAKILKRKDASSVLVAIVLAMIIGQLLQFTTGELAAMLSGLKDGEMFTYSPPGGTWKQTYLFPIVSAIIQIVALEILARIVVGGSAVVGKSAKRKN